MASPINDHCSTVTFIKSLKEIATEVERNGDVCFVCEDTSWSINKTSLQYPWIDVNNSLGFSSHKACLIAWKILGIQKINGCQYDENSMPPTHAPRSTGRRQIKITYLDALKRVYSDDSPFINMMTEVHKIDSKRLSGWTAGEKKYETKADLKEYLIGRMREDSMIEDSK